MTGDTRALPWGRIDEVRRRGEFPWPEDWQSLNASQRCVIAADLTMALQRETSMDRRAGSTRLFAEAQREGVAFDGHRNTARYAAAHALNVSETNVQKVIHIKHEDPDAFERLRRGESAVLTEYKKLRAQPASQLELSSADKRRANTQKDDMVSILSHARGAVRGLSDARVDLLRAILTRKEVDTWAILAREQARILNTFAYQLQKKGESNASNIDTETAAAV